MAEAKRTHTLSGSDRALQIGMAAVGAALLLGSLGVVVKGAVGPEDPALVDVVETERSVIGGRTRVGIAAVNRGDVTASAVRVEGMAGPDRTATVTLDHVPGRSRKAATLMFDGDLGRAPLALRATGWADP